ncbi:NAD-dependent epimerase/dehydratase family protein [Hymenobacter gummosus]|uniref:NAD-dependent epimerase/dehydratase family protein n=1 Tax=Hymenobacter gummosus TaxID=1776032 RepID=A0A3S0H4V6_9BACT|nr:NAD-dependent epimerase/dehydratase family protein [Hymenobacter gummosus]RTQ47896.1 NAD-dependent epimerase/dehydratase family protein [Hymenobacter gummosus]
MKVIVTGATGMVGEGVLLECLQDTSIEQVLVVTRRPTGRQHPKLREVLLADFEHPESIESELRGYDACYFCLGVSSVGLKEPEYRRLTYDLTLGFARTLARQSPQLTFCYVSGAGTDSTEKGRQMWARVKGRTENELLRLPFRAAYMFRPGFMKVTPGQRNILPFYKYIAWLYPLARRLTPGFVSTMAEVGRAMINVTRHGYEKRVLEVKDIVELAARYRD